MIYKMSVPAADPDVQEFRILEWHYGPDDAVEAGELIIELETHKAVVEVRAGQAGILREQLCKAGDWCVVGVPLGIFTDSADESLPPLDQVTFDLAIEFEIT